MAGAAVALACCANSTFRAESDLDVYADSLMIGLHGHPIGPEGRRLDGAERAIAKRREPLREWLVTRVGEAKLAKLEQDALDAADGVYWTNSPSEEYEWDRIHIARRALGELERRHRLAEGHS